MREILVTTEEFKDSPVGIIPKDWNFKALSELADVDRGKFIYRPRNDPRLYGGSYPFIQTGDIASASGGILTTYSQTLNERGISVSRQFPIGTIAITIAANIADTAILGIPMYFPDSVVGAVVKKPNSIRYVELCIHRAKQKLEARAPQSAQKNINLEDLRPLLIPVPSTEEQQKIAEIIDTIDKAIALTDTHIAKLKKAKAGLLHDLLTRGIDEHGELRDYTRNPELFKRSALGIIPKDWEAIALLDVVPKIEYGISVSLDDQEGIPILRMNNLFDGEVDIADLKKSASSEAEKLLLQVFDVLFNRTNSIEHVGRTGIWRGQLKKASFASYLVRLIPDKSRLLPEYLNIWLNFAETQIIIRRYATPSVHQVNINPTNLRKVVIALSQQINEQKLIVEKVEIFNNRIRQKQAYFEKLKLLKKGLMSDLLTGRVRVKI